MNPSMAFADAARPRRVVILRLPLLDYSVGHEILLTQKRNPMLGQWEDFQSLPLAVQCQSAIQAVSICSRTWEQNKKPESNFWLWQWLIRKANWPLEMYRFFEYREAGSTFPVCLPPESEGRSLGSPLMARLAAFTQNFDSPLGLAQWLYFSHCETIGNCKVENDDEREGRESEAKIRADYVKEKEAKRCQL
jgi:hypothetical protein